MLNYNLLLQALSLRFQCLCYIKLNVCIKETSHIALMYCLDCREFGFYLLMLYNNCI